MNTFHKFTILYLSRNTALACYSNEKNSTLSSANKKRGEWVKIINGDEAVAFELRKTHSKYHQNAISRKKKIILSLMVSLFLVVVY